MEEEKQKETQNEETPKKSNREQFMERYRIDFPDDNFEDEEAVFGRMNERNTDYDRLRTNDNNFRKLVSEHPQYGAMVGDMMEGRNFIESFLARFSDEDITAARNDPEMAKKLADAQAEYLKSVEDNKKFDEEREVNVQQSIKELNAYCHENDIDSDVANEIWGKCLDHAVELVKLKFTRDLFDLIYKGMNHDDDVAAARQEGEIAGHNAKVQTQMAKGRAPEGIPPTFDGGQGSAAPEQKPKQKKKVYDPFSHEYIEVED